MHKTLRKLPSLDFLKGFEAAGRLLSFTRAAEELFLTQSALSRQIQALEQALGIALFERHHRALVLTPPGRRCIARSPRHLPRSPPRPSGRGPGGRASPASR